MITLVLYIRPLPNLTTWLSCGRRRIRFILGSKVKVTVLMTPIYIGFFPFHRGIMWSCLVKIQHTELKLSCGNDPVVKNFIYSKWPWPLGSLPNLTTWSWFPCLRGRTLFILGSLPLYCLIIYRDRHILLCTHLTWLHIFRIKQVLRLGQFIICAL
jgi:hypothetical protein